MTKAFDERVVLNGIDVTIRRGEIVAIVGGSGSGKTVLLHLLAGLLPPTSGRVLAADHALAGSPLVDLATLDADQLDDLRLSWAVVFQRNALFSGSVYENIALFLRERTELSETEIDARVRESLAAAALNVEDVIRKDRDELSGGMAKRVAIARAIAIRPAVMFYDEPTTGLDPVVGAHIHDLIWSTHHATADGPRTSIVITHDKDLLRRLHPRLIMLHNGGICFAGEYRDFADQTAGPASEYMRAMPVLHAKPMSR